MKRNKPETFANRKGKKQEASKDGLYSKYAAKTGVDDYKLDWFVPDPQQSEIIQSMVWNDLTIVNGKSGTGKAQPLSCAVKTPNGDVTLGDIQVGDDIFRTDGGVGKVLAKFPQKGLQPTYEVTFRDGAKTLCNGEHLWTCFTSRGNLKTLTLNEIITKGLKTDSGMDRVKIPLTQPVQYEEKSYYIHPYALGILLGDGYLCGSSPAFSVGEKDKEVFDIFNTLHPEWKYKERSTGANCKQYNVSTPNTTRNNLLMRELTRLGLNVKSDKKFIPDIYLKGSIEQRLELLRGLMDSDGSSVRNRTNFTSTAIGLIKGMKELIQSLGGTAIETYVDQRGNNPCYTLNVKMFVNPFKVKSKANLWKFSYKNPPSRYMKSIEYVGETEQVCIKVDADNSLYLTDEFIVTHNTTSALWKALQMLKAGDFRKLLFVKTPVETGDDQIGFLSGDKNDKLSTHFETTKRIFLEFMSSGKLETDISNGKIELTIPNYLLGSTWDNSIVIIDEAQLMSASTVKLLLERAGENTRVIILGDAAQRYAIKKRENGLEDLILRVVDFNSGDEPTPVEDFIGFVELTSENNHRSRLSKFITEIY
ncbi:MAG: hypothetical protein [Caudoviricetes sp.]|nr:MAG: hypothetical protein [Caudoviricetes sp.]